MQSRLQKLQEFLAGDPLDTFTRYAIGLEYAKEKNFAEAIKTLEELRASHPDYIPTYYMLASYYRETEDKGQALAIYKAGIERSRAVNDRHALSELQAAMDELEDEM